MRGWLVLYSFGGNYVLPKHYKTQKNAIRFAEEHRRFGQKIHGKYEAIVLNVEDVVAWINSGVDELERMFKL